MKITKQIISILLLCGILLSMLLTAFATEAEAAEGNYDEGLWNIDGQYRQLRPDLTKGGYWDSTASGSHNKVITSASDSGSYFATPRFTKTQIPVGSVIVVEEGWQYLPEGWVKDERQSSRPAETTEKHVVVTSEWWGSFTLRAFNIRRTDGRSLSDLNPSDIHEAFRIYLPDEYIAAGYERFYPKLERCAYWSSEKNKIYTVNSSATAVNYYTTQRMKKSHLPVGSVIVFEKGWTVQCEAWLADEPQATTQPALTSNVIYVTEDWWGDYALRAFNLSRTTPCDMTNYTTEDMHCIFRVYVPKETLTIDALADTQTNRETKIHQLPSRTPLADGDMEKMMSYIIETRGGKIIVIDGGCPTDNLDGDYLFAYLQRITGQAKPHVDAWFFTHAHLDHFGAYLSVAASHSKEITVDAVYHRFPTMEEAEKYLYKFNLETYKKYLDKINSHTAKLKTANGEPTPLISVNARHTGKCNSTFDFDEVHIDVLLTVEDVYWGADHITGKYTGNLETNGKVYNMTVAEMLCYNMNETSIVFRATFSGKTVLFLGDGTTATEIMLKYYHNINASDPTKYFKLKSDIVQISHHGVQAMGSEVYDLINPDVALWCIPYGMYASRPGDELTTYYIRQWFRRLATTNYISYDGVDVLSYGVLRYDTPVSIASDIKPYVFDAQYYADRYPDLKAAYGTDETKLYQHFINYGIEEGRCASPYFDVKIYMNYNSQGFQEENKGNYEKAFKHFLSNCKKNNRMKLSETFDAAIYASNHPELSDSTTELELLKHYVAAGAREYATDLHLSATGDSYHRGYVVEMPKDPTCTAEGSNGAIYCTGCGEEYIPAQTLPAMGHSYVSSLAEPSCTEGSVIPDTAFFANFTGESTRYTSSVYGGVDYDSASNWSLLTSRYLKPEIDTVSGTLKTGFRNTDYGHLWIQTGASYNSNFNLNYEPKSGHVAQIRMKFEGLQVSSSATAAKMQLYYFVGTGSSSETVYALDPISITADQLRGDYVTFRFNIKGIDSASHTKFTSLRVQVGNLESVDPQNPGTMTFDYIYLGPAEGKIATYTCTTCGEERTLDESPMGHCVVNLPGRDATCTESGLTAGSYCSVCGVVYEKQEVIPAKGHTLTTDRGYGATCTTYGLTDGQHCTTCGTITRKQEPIASTGHTCEYVDGRPLCEVGAYIPENAFFANFTKNADRYTTGAVYSGVDYDDGKNWSVITSRYKAPVVDQHNGTLTTGFASRGYNHLWLQTGADYNTGFNLNYQPENGHVARIRVKFENLALKAGAKTAKIQIYYFIGPDRFEGAGSTEKIYTMDAYDITAEQVTGGEFVTLNFPVKGLDSDSHKRITALRVQISNLESTDINALGQIVFDYIYVGPDGANIITEACTACGDSNTVDSAPALGHKETSAAAVAPTCTASGLTEGTYCSVCNKILSGMATVEATGHSYTYKATKNPTTSATGTLTGTCSVCNGATTVTLPKLNTTDYTKTTAKAPTCTATGTDKYTWKTTTYGSFYFNVTTAAKGHAEVTDAAVAPTCTATGLTEGKHCSVCSAVLTAQQTVPAKGHTEVIDKAVSATCTATGLTEGKHCSVCNTVLTAQETVAALGHDYKSVVTAPTCTAEGYTTHTCSRCSDSYVDSKVSATGHNYTYKASKNPTTSATGTLTGTCSKCNGTTTVTLPKLTTTDYTKTTTKAPTCTATGTDKYTWKTTTYGSFYFNVTTAAKGHTSVADKAVDPTCTATGLTAGAHCSVCNAVLTVQETVAALGHDYKSVVTAPTCTAEGYTTHTCSRCSDSYVDSKVSATDHNYTYQATKNPTTSATGTLTGTCSKCNGTTTVTLPKLTTTDYTKTTTKAPTCTATGTDKYTWKTTTYGSFYFNVTTKAKGHTSVADKAVDPTCTATGLTAGAHCSVCNAVLTAQEVVPATGHTEVIDKAVAPTCTATGLTEGKHCSVCKTVLTAQQVVPAKGHSYEADITEATCTVPGIAIYTCACGESYTEILAITPHKTVFVPMIPPTCSEAGQKEHYLCSECGAVFADGAGEYPIPQWYLPIESFGHLCRHVVTEPTCTKKGFTTYICACGETYISDEVEALGHREVIDEGVVPTCTATGLTEGKHCSVCDEILTAREIIPATGHAPIYTFKDDESHIMTCKNCDYVAEKVHEYVDGLCICGQNEIKEPIQESKWKIGHTLNLASDISVNLAVSKSLLTGFDMDTVYILAEIDLYTENEKTGTKTVKLLPVEQGNYYYFTLTGLTAVNMNDRIRSVLYGTKDGQEYYSPVDDYSIADYAYSQMNKPAGVPEKLKVLCAELLRYGSAAQIYKNYRVDNLADSKMTDTHKAYLSDIEAVTFGNTNVTLNDLSNASIKWVGKSLNLDSKVCLKFIFSKGAYAGDIADLTLHVSYTDTYGATKEVILTGAELYNEKLGYYAFTLDTMLAAELRSVVSVQVYSGNTPVSCTLQYSADTYGNNKTGTLLDVCKALFAYSDSAKSYFAG